jgi:RHS repeat-associated protein
MRLLMKVGRRNREELAIGNRSDAGLVNGMGWQCFRRTLTLLEAGGVMLACLLGAVVMLPLGALAQAQQGIQAANSVDTNSASYTVTDLGGSYRVWQNVVPSPADQSGQVAYQTNSFTELATGMNYMDNGQWMESSENIQITAEGGAATNGQHQVEFAADINTSNAVLIITPDHLQLKTHIMGLSYYDSGTGSNVLFAELQSSVGQLVGNNGVVYSNAFSDCDVDVRYTYTRAGFEQDIVVQRQLPTPDSFGLNPDTSWLQVWTEFSDSPTPGIEPILNGTDERLDFGIMKMERGKAFIMGSESNSVPVNKTWTSVNGRTFLVEQVAFDTVATQLQSLPAPSASGGAGSGTDIQQIRYQGFPKRLPPPPRLAKRANEKLQMAKASAPNKGLVLDYALVNGSITNQTFQGDTTYLISGNVNLYGTTTIEGGTVVKFTNSGPNLCVYGSVSCQTAPYRMAVFTAQDDDTVGLKLPGSTGSPSGYYATYAIEDESQSGGAALNYMRISYASTGCYFNYTSASSLKHCQFVNDGSGINDYNGLLNIENVLFDNISGVVVTASGYAEISAENVTVDTSGLFYNGAGTSTMGVTNCLLVNDGFSGYGWAGAYNFTASSSSVFTNAGAGAHYLATGAYRGQGTTNIDPGLLADLRNMTTYPPATPPSFSTDNIPTVTTNTILTPYAARDTNTMPDVGYHYSPIDYMTTSDYSNCVVTMTNGVVLGYWRNFGISLDNGSQLVSQGGPIQRNAIAYYTLVQEQAVKLMGSDTNLADYPSNSLPIVTSHSNTGQNPSIYLRFTSIYAPQGAGNILNISGAGNAISNLTARDCEIYGAGAALELADQTGAVNLNNNLFQYTPLTAYASGAFGAFNNLYRGNSNYTFWVTNSGGSVTNRDNAFDGTSVNIAGTNGWNAYLNLTTNNVLNPIYTNDIVTNLTWVTGPLGIFYQATTSPLINAGSTTANLLGLYHYTVLTNQVKETNSTVDIGYHYVALGTNGIPADSNGDGIPDYLEDANGNGLDDPGETPWNLAILSQPQNVNAVLDQSVSFYVTAGGIGTFTYQWSFNTTNIVGATNATLSLTSVQTTNAGNYAVVVANASTNILSSNAVLTVLAPGISITSPTNGATFYYNSSDPVTVPILTSVVQGDTPTATNVQFFQGSVLLGQTNGPSFQYSWSNMPAGLYTLTAIASYSEGYAVTSAPVNISVMDSCTTTYQSNNAFGAGFLMNLNYTNAYGRLQLNPQAGVFPFINIPCGNDDTLVRINTSNNAVVGEYVTAPALKPSWPGHAMVDRYGNVWVANWDERGHMDASGLGSITRIGIVIGGTRITNGSSYYLQPPFTYSTAVDRNGDGLIQTSIGLGNVLTWTNSSVTNLGSITNAQDECIINYVRVPSQLACALSLDGHGDLWVGGWCDHSTPDVTNGESGSDVSGTRMFVKVDGITGQVITNTQTNFNSGAYGGFDSAIATNGFLWTSGGAEDGSGSSNLVIFDPVARTNEVMFSPAGNFATAIDPQTGHIWVTTYDSGTVAVYDESGNHLTDYNQGANNGSGLAFDNSNHVWIAHGCPTVGTYTITRMRTDGTLQTNINIHSFAPDGVETVAVDASGKIWGPATDSPNVVIIDPATLVVSNIVLTGHGGGEGTGSLIGQLPTTNMAPYGFWDVVNNGGTLGEGWGTITWNASTNDTSQVRVEARAADKWTGLTSTNFQVVQNGVPLTNVDGEFLEIRVTLLLPTGGTNSPWLQSLTVSCGSPTNYPPTITLVSPTNSQVFPVSPTNILMQATASDSDGTVTNVAFYQGSTKLGQTNSPASGTTYQFLWQGVTNGTYTLSAVASDNLGATSTNTVTNVTVLITVPVVSITNPTNSATFGPSPATLTVNATAFSLNGAISNVEFFDNATNPIGITGVATNTTNFLITWVPVMAGSHSLTARATDVKGSNALSSAVAFSVKSSPTINITFPTNGSVFGPYPTNITITAGAFADPSLSITNVQFFQGGVLLGNSTSSSGTNYSRSWTNSTSGTFALTAVAKDSTSASKVSRTVNVTITATNQPPAVNPGTNQTIQLPAVAMLLGTVSDDGLPLGSKLSILWTNVTVGGPGPVTFTNPNQAETMASFVTNGTYTLQLKAGDTQYTVTSNITVTVNSGLVVDLCTNRLTLVLPPAPAASATNPVIELSPVVQLPAYYLMAGDLYQASDVDCLPLSNDLIISMQTAWTEYDTNFEMLSTNGSLSEFSSLEGLRFDPLLSGPIGHPLPVSTVKDTLGSFAVGDVFTDGDGWGEVIRMRPDGSIEYGTNALDTNSWVILPDSSEYVFGLYVDRTGVFGGDLIVAVGDGGIWRVNSQGAFTELAQIPKPPGDSGGIVTVPNNPAQYGPWAGRILVAGGSALYTVDTNGVVVSYAAFQPIDVKLVDPSDNLFGVDARGHVALGVGNNVLWSAPSSAFQGLAGDIMISSQADDDGGDGGSGFNGLYTVRWNGTSFEQTSVACLPEGTNQPAWEGIDFAPVGVPGMPPAPSVQLCGTVLDNWTNANTTNILWIAVSGPGTVTFDFPTALSTSARFSAPGFYDLRLLATNGVQTAYADAIVQVVADQPPAVSVGPDQVLASLSTSLIGNISDDGWPSNQLSAAWSLISGPGTATFGWTATNVAATSFNAADTVSFSANGTYVLQLSATDGQATNTALLTVTVGTPRLTFSPAYTGPLPTNTTQTLTALLVNDTGAVITNTNVTFVVRGANPTTNSLNTGTNGLAAFTYLGTNNGRDWIQASATVGSITVTSRVAVVDWGLNISCGSQIVVGSLINAGSLDTTISTNESRSADYFLFPAQAGTNLTFTLLGLSGGTPDTNAPDISSEGLMLLKNQSNQLVAFSSTGTLDYTPPTAGNYALEVTWLWTNSFTTNNDGFALSLSCGGLPELAVLLNGTNLPSGSTLNFGTVSPDNNETISMVLTNPGSAALDIGGLTASTNTAFKFGFTPSTLTTIPAGSSAGLWVSFAMTNTGAGADSLSFSHNAEGSNYVLTLIGQSFPSNGFPQVELTSPIPGVQYLAPGPILLTAAVIPGSNAVSQVSFTANGIIPIGSVSTGVSGNYSLTWANVPAGNYTITATAVDTVGRTTTSPSVSVQVIAPNQYPVANDVSVTVAVNSQNNLINVLAGDTYYNGYSYLAGGLQSLSDFVSSASYPAPSSMTIVGVSNFHASTNVTIINDGQAISYTPPANQSGNDWFTYTVQNASGLAASGQVWVTIPSVGTPQVVLTSPTNGTYNAGSPPVTITAVGTAFVASVASVQIYLDTNLLATSANATNTVNWTGLVGDHSVYAVVTDSVGQQAQSSTVDFTVVQTNTAYGLPIAAINNVTNQIINGQQAIPMIQAGTFNLIGTASTTNTGDVIAYQINLLQPDGTLLANLTQNQATSGVAAGFHIGAVSNGVLNTNDFTMIQNGPYILELVVLDTNSFEETETNVSFILNSNLKLGEFGFSQQDLVIPASGLPLTVTRTYNSINPALGDFGYGWTYAISDLQVSLDESREMMGDEDSQDNSNFSMRVGGNRDVTLTLPNGQRTTFSYYLAPGGCALGLCAQATWAAAPGVNATLTAEGNTTFDAIDELGGSYPPFWDAAPDVPVDNYDFPGFILTMQDGTAYTISRQSLGTHDVLTTDGESFEVHAYGNCYLSKIVAPTLDKTTINQNSIVHTSANGQFTNEVVFQRQNGLIVSISDPNGLVAGVPTGPPAVKYGYDGNQNLVNVFRLTDRAANGGQGAYDVTTFTYTNAQFPHYITGIIDPSGNTPARTLYDSSGRMIGVVDAFGHTNSFAPNLGARTETVTDRLGNPTTYSYDTSGNVTLTIDALSRPTQKAYDANNNPIMMVDALNNTNFSFYDPSTDNLLATTNALGHTNGFTYDGQGHVLTSIDARGIGATNTYDQNTGNLLSTVNALGQTNTCVYDTNSNLLIQQIDPLGNKVTNGYDGNGNLIITVNLNSVGNVLSSNTFAYDGNGNRTNQTVYRTVVGVLTAETTTSIYDAQNRLIQTVDPLGFTNTTDYDVNGRQQATIDKLGRKTTCVYDDMGQLISTIYPDQTSESTAYDADGRRIFSTNRLGFFTQYQYDAVGQLTNTISPDLSTNSTVYDLDGRVQFSIDARGFTNAFGYDAVGQQIAVTNAVGKPEQMVTTNAYDANGNRTVTTDPLQHSTTSVYDALNRVTTNLFQDGTFQVTAFDALGRKVAQTDQATNTTHLGYDSLGRLTSVTNALQKVTQYGYDEVGNEISQTDALNRQTTFGYDALGRRTKRTLPGLQFETFSYDPNGNLLDHTDFNGLTVTNQYDLMNRLTNVLSTNVVLESYGYDLVGQMTSRVDTSGSYSWVYDNRGRITTTTTPVGTLYYGYDANGNQASLSSATPGGVSVIYRYDALNRLTNATDNRLTGNTNTFYGFDPVGNLQTVQYPNGATNLYSYDTLNRLKSVVWKTNGVQIAGFSYVLGPTGNRTSLNETNGTAVRGYTWGYDNLYRLTSEAISTTAPTGTLGYTYDNVGNRLLRTNLVTGIGLTNQSFAYNTNDWLTTDAYDTNGNTLWTTNGTVQGPYQYDYANRLTNFNSGAVKIIYGADGNRIWKATSTRTNLYLVATVNPTGYPQVVEETTITNGATNLTIYTYGMALISQRQTNTSTNFFITDGHGSTRVLSDVAGNVVNAFAYDAYGTLISSTSTPQTAYLYCCEQFDADVGQYYLRARYMNPDTGRFWTMDTYAGNNTDPLSLHKYQYTDNNPANGSDTSGHQDTMTELASEQTSGSLDAVPNTATVNAEGASLQQKILPVHAYSLAKPGADQADFAYVSDHLKDANSILAKASITLRLSEGDFHLWDNETTRSRAGDSLRIDLSGKGDAPGANWAKITEGQNPTVANLYFSGAFQNDQGEEVPNVLGMTAGKQWGNPCYPAVFLADPWGNVIAHEVGHLLGLKHVDDQSNLMYPQTANSVSSATGLSKDQIETMRTSELLRGH